MNLPLVLEIAIGLIFIYLTLSLVASEVQEILSALFQWRAEHLKRSIEQLLAGENRPQKVSAGDWRSHQQAAREMADRLYDSPLIASLNYEAQGRLPGLLRSLLHGIGSVYRLLTFSRNVFGTQTSGPSYIPADAFATSLVERLRLEDFRKLLERSRLSELLDRDIRSPLYDSLQELRALSGNETLLSAEAAHLDLALNGILQDLASRRLNANVALSETYGQLQAFEAMATDLLLSQPPNTALEGSPLAVQAFLSRLRYLRQRLGGPTPAHGTAEDNELPRFEALVGRLQPTLKELITLLDPKSPTYRELVALSQREGGDALALLEWLQQEVVPPSLQKSLAVLGQRAEAKLQQAGAELQQFQLELETWFNQGMERATGVYRRNVKGVGLMIGFVIAFAVNADTLYMFQHLSSDSAIRSSLLQAAEQWQLETARGPEDLPFAPSLEDIPSDLANTLSADLRSVGSALEDALQDYPLPIGRSEPVLAAQRQAQESWPFPYIPRRLVGWSITALALSMGASFWFDLLRRVTSVRATGDRPPA